MNTLTQAMAMNTAQAKKKEEESVLDKVKTFHQKQWDALTKDPDNFAHKETVKYGKHLATKFMDSVTNAADPMHEKSFAQFRDKYNKDPRQVAEDFVEEACKANGTAAYEMADPNYEKKVLDKYKPSGNAALEQHKFYENFKAAMREKWNSGGYRGDNGFVQNYTAKYGLTPSDNVHDLKIFEPKK